MPRRVLSVLRGADPGAPRSAAPALDLNAYAVAEDVDLTLVLAGPAVELALAAPDAPGLAIEGVDLPRARPRADVAALAASGVTVVALADDLADRGLGPDDLAAGIGLASNEDLAALIVDSDVTLTSSNA